MSPFFTELLDNYPGPAFLEKVRGKYHYEKDWSEALKKSALEMLPFLQKEAFWESMPAEWSDTVSLRQSAPEEENAAGSRRKAAGTKYERVVISLGAGLDRLQEQYSEQGSLSKSYMLEALASELLLQGYRAYNRHVREICGWHVARYHFPGSEKSLPLDILPHILSRFSVQVSCNEAFCIIPKKSVVFLAELTQDEKVRCEGICVGCGNISCFNRMEEDAQMERIITDMPLTYGYQRIFGKW